MFSRNIFQVGVIFSIFHIVRKNYVKSTKYKIIESF